MSIQLHLRSRNSFLGSKRRKKVLIKTTAERGAKMPGALEGIRILEWASWINGPSAGAMLADLGAEVIKVEDRIRGDPMRGSETLYGSSMVASGINLAYELYNRNKKSITVDMAKEKGKEVVYRLVKNSDVFLTNYGKSLAAKLGVDYETLSKHNPQIIYAYTSGYGSRGLERERRAFDFVGQARSGMMSTMGERGTPPVLMVGAPTDQLGSIMLAYGILAALVARERSGIGQEVETSMIGAAMHIQVLPIGVYLLQGREMARHSRTNTKSPFSNYYQCADGKWLLLSEPQVDRFWPQICRALGLEKLEEDPRFNNVASRRENARELISILDKVLTTRNREEWLRILGEEVGIACSPVLSIAEVVNDPQVLENNYIVESDHPVLGRVKIPGFPVSFSRSPPEVRSAAPHFGQHTEEVLLQVGGYTWDEIAELKEQEVT